MPKHSIHPAAPSGLPEVLYADEWVVAFNKPVPMLSVPGIGPEKADCLVSRAQTDYPGARIVHRLDRDTSGVIVLALDADTHRHLSIQFQERLTTKRYEAIVLGVPAAGQGVIEAPIRKDLDNPPRQCVDPIHGKPSETAWHVLERNGDRARIELMPRTGRSHQLRLHLLHIGHPILGDDLYAPREGRAMANRLCLHATMLRIQHPVTGNPLVLRSPAPF
ncbi:MAG: RluA family pseudouridine synthase [Phycisphaerales bacterium]|jgi:tRNA pseudouridine32 synthase/23S rRNA pseudouridine746 synthase|nr:RluA family pseudouridine synthase [Phycisphaerales bacterium]